MNTLPHSPFQVVPFDAAVRLDGYLIPTTDRYIPVAMEPWPFHDGGVRARYAHLLNTCDPEDAERRLRVKEYKHAHFDFFSANSEEQRKSWLVREDGRIVRRTH